MRTHRLIAVAAVASGWWLSASPSFAHHSFAAEWDSRNCREFTGTLTRIDWQNPHPYFYVDVKDASGKIEQWSFEAGTPSGMIRNGYRPGVIKAGDEVTIKGFQSKDPDVRGMLRKLTTADGKVYGLFGPQENRPQENR